MDQKGERQEMSLSNITNAMIISERIASSGQPEEYQFKAIAQAGYQVVMNLAMPNSDNAIPEEGNIVTARRMVYVHIPVPFAAPTVRHLRQFLAVMDAFQNERVWIHCAANYRASAFLYQYMRLSQNVSDDQARKVMFPSWEPDDIWKDFMAIPKNQVM